MKSMHHHSPTKKQPNNAINPTHAASIALITTALFGALATPPTHANIIKKLWLNPDAYIYEIKHMPDFDQRRVAAAGVPGLPANGGMYCVPTSALNLMAYAANHGFPNIQPGDQPWYITNNADRYDQITEDLIIMGVLMGTDPIDGTGGNGQANGVNTWLNVLAPGQFTVTQQWAWGDWSPKASDMAFAGANGWIVSPGYGFYDKIQVGDLNIIVRVGGHIVSLVRAAATDVGESDFRVRDPADVPNDNIQLPFTTRQWIGINEQYADFNDPAGLDGIRTMTRLEPPSGTSGTLRILDGYIAIRPKAGYAFTNEEIPPQIKLFAEVLFTGGGTPEVLSIPAEGFSTIKDLLIHPDSKSVVAIGEINGIATAIQYNTLAQPVAVIDADESITGGVFGRFRELYLTKAQSIVCYNPDNLTKEPVPIDWPFPPGPIAFDDVNDLVVSISQNGQQLATVPALFPEGALPQVTKLPNEIKLGENPGITISPDDGTIWVWSSISPVIYQIRRVPETGELSLLNTAQIDGCIPERVQAGDAERLYVQCDGTIRELRPVEDPDEGIVWKVAEDGLFDGVTGLGETDGFVAEVSRTNQFPGYHDLEGWTTNILPEELEFGAPIADCVADLNDDRVIDSEDLGILLGSFGSDFIGDLNVDQVTDTVDLGILLGVFGQDCP